MQNMFKQGQESKSDDQWEHWWNARIEAMQAVLGEMDNMVHHATIPFQVGAELGGDADVVSFSEKLDGIAYVTSELIGNDSQKPNQLGNYELMICHRAPLDWGPTIISRLAYYTLDTALNPGETMDIGPATPEGSTITAFLFLKYAAFKVLERDAGLLLCIGITQDELDVCQEQGSSMIEHRLKEGGVYPYTDLTRSSVLL
jgi:Suppressor of fused protein (SUFU)